MINYDSVISENVKSLAPSGIRKFFDLLENMEDAISLGVGEPDFVTPWHIRDAGIRSLERGYTKYTGNAGLSRLRVEIAKYLNRKFDLEYDAASQIIVTVGGSEAIDLAVRALVNPGDEVIVPVPSFVCYGPIAALAGGEPVYLRTKAENEFRLTPEELRGAITPNTKILILPFPSNPTGAVMERNDLEAIAEVLRGTDIMVISDEIYAELTYGMKHTSFASLPGMNERTVTVNGFSKCYSMTGWRLGYACAPEPVARQMLKIHQYAVMCAPTMSQYAAVEALREGDGDIDGMRREYDNRRKLLYNGLRNIGIDCFEPRGAFYMFPYIGKFGLTSEEFCERFLMEERVAMIPGTAFGDSGEGFTRICYAASEENLREALNRLERFTARLM